MKIVFLIVGFLSLFLGIVGIFLPLLPTVPFLLLTAWCFSKANPGLLRWVLRFRWFRYYIRGYLDGRGVPARVKIFSLTLLWLSGLFSVFILLERWWLKILVILILGIVTWHIIKIPVERR